MTNQKFRNSCKIFFFRRLSSSPSTGPAQTRKLTHTSQKKVHTRTPGPGLRSVPISSPVSQNEILNWPTRWCEEKLSSVLLKYSFKQCAACQLWQQQPQTRCAAISYNLPGAHPYEIFGCMLKSTVMLMYKGLCSTDSSLYEQEFNPSVFHILDTWRRSFILSLFSSLPWSRLWKIIVYLATSADGLTTRIFCISTLIRRSSSSPPQPQ